MAKTKWTEIPQILDPDVAKWADRVIEARVAKGKTPPSVVWHYMDGFLPNSYYWNSYGTRAYYKKSASTGAWLLEDWDEYGKLRSWGMGPEYAAKTASRGHVASYSYGA